MAKFILVFLGLLLNSLQNNSMAQQIHFSKPTDSIFIKLKEPAQYKVQINCIGCKSARKAVVSKIPSNYPDSLFSVFNKDTIVLNSKQPGFVLIEIKYLAALSGKSIGLKLTDVSDSSETPSNYFFLQVYEKKDKNEPDSMKYRFMIGTNFDFIDGVQAKNLYYHLQVFQPKAVSKSFGFIGGIQQNRQVSQTDTLFPQTIKQSANFFRDSLRNASFRTLSADSFRITRLDSVKFNQISTATIFQIYIEPTFKIFTTPSENPSKTELLALLHGDIHFRRTKYEESYSYKVIDSVTVGRSGRSKYTPIPDGTIIKQINNFQFHYGAGLLLHHENTFIDLYAKFMVGIVTVTKNNSKGFYASELGIRAPGINVMLGAEYRGLMGEHNPQYFNVYLSKVFSLNKLKDLIMN
jgi:hypothetical protein